MGDASSMELMDRVGELQSIVKDLLDTIKVQTEETVLFLSGQIETNGTLSKDMLHTITINFNTEQKVSRLLNQLETGHDPYRGISNHVHAMSTT